MYASILEIAHYIHCTIAGLVVEVVIGRNKDIVDFPTQVAVHDPILGNSQGFTNITMIPLWYDASIGQEVIGRVPQEEQL